MSDAETFVQFVQQQARDTNFAITREGDLVGTIGIDLGTPDVPEIGYWLGVPYWGQGYATEAARAVIDYAFEEFGSTELRAGARVVNPASRRVLEKCGFQWTGVELRRVLSLGSLGAGRSLPARPRRLELAEVLAGRRAALVWA